MSVPRKGIIVPLVTPFTDREDVDFAGFRRNIDFQMGKNTHGFIVLPTAGEAPSLTTDESLRLIDIAVETSDSKPVIVGVGGLSIRRTETLMRHAEDAGAAGFFVISPYFYKVTPAEYVTYYQRIARSTALDLLIYNSTYANMPLSPDIIEVLAEEPNIVAIKEGNQLQLGEVVRRVGHKMSVFTARDVYIYETLATGGDGAISFSANVAPDLVLALFAAAEAGNYEQALNYQFELNPLVWALVSRSYPAPLKAAMDHLGLAGGRVRAPLTNLTEGEKQAVIQQVDVLRKEF
jgi:4-hydroxy-tetrahydrodipicolinate synthase